MHRNLQPSTGSLGRVADQRIHPVAADSVGRILTYCCASPNWHASNARANLRMVKPRPVAKTKSPGLPVCSIRHMLSRISGRSLPVADRIQIAHRPRTGYRGLWMRHGPGAQNVSPRRGDSCIEQDAVNGEQSSRFAILRVAQYGIGPPFGAIRRPRAERRRLFLWWRRKPNISGMSDAR